MNLLNDINRQINENDKQSWGSIMNFTPISVDSLKERIDSYIKTSTLKQEIIDVIKSHLNTKDKEKFYFNKKYNIVCYQYNWRNTSDIFEFEISMEAKSNSLLRLNKYVGPGPSYKKN